MWLQEMSMCQKEQIKRQVITIEEEKRCITNWAYEIENNAIRDSEQATFVGEFDIEGVVK